MDLRLFTNRETSDSLCDVLDALLPPAAVWGDWPETDPGSRDLALRFVRRCSGLPDLTDLSEYYRAILQDRAACIAFRPDEVVQFFEGIDSIKYRAILITAYTGGLRVSEV